LKSVVIFYFSGTGNTWWVSHTIVRQLSHSGVDTSAHSIEQVSPTEADELIHEADVVAFGYPIYGSDVPLPMKDFLRGLRGIKAKDALVFCTQWLWSGDGARIGATFAEGKGFSVKWGEHFHMPNNLCVAFPIPIHTNAPTRKAKYLRHSENRASRLTSHMLAGKPFRRGFSFFAELNGLIQRAPYRRFMEHRRNNISVNKEPCTECGLCTGLCPTGNLVLTDKGIMSKELCVTCMRCYNFCPETAFLFRSKPHKHHHGETYKGPVDGFDPKILTLKRTPGTDLSF
jgi:ferredoxin/flavodoxin